MSFYDWFVSASSEEVQRVVRCIYNMGFEDGFEDTADGYGDFICKEIMELDANSALEVINKYWEENHKRIDWRWKY